MSKRWRVNDGTQVDVGGKIRTGGEQFTATDNELDEFGSRAYVTEVEQEREQPRDQAAPKAENKAQPAPESRSRKA